LGLRRCRGGHEFFSPHCPRGGRLLGTSELGIEFIPRNLVPRTDFGWGIVSQVSELVLVLPDVATFIVATPRARTNPGPFLAVPHVVLPPPMLPTK
jgi:hypothetical protein